MESKGEDNFIPRELQELIEAYEEAERVKREIGKAEKKKKARRPSPLLRFKNAA